MRWKRTTCCLALAAVGVVSSGCDPVVQPSYRGESRLSLRVVVLNSQSANPEQIVPAFAHVDDQRVVFRQVDYRNDTFGSEYRVDVYDAPTEELIAPVDPLLAPDVLVARERIGAVLKSRIDETIWLHERVLPVHPPCWNSACDHLPGRMTMPCEEDDRECLARQRQCPMGACQVVDTGAVLPEGVENITGFADDYMVLYAPKAVRARSWAAWKLGAPDGLEAGYHIGKILVPDAQARRAADACFEQAHTDVFAAFNEEHGTDYDGFTYACLTDPVYFVNSNCEGAKLPEGAEREELAAALVTAELDGGCFELAPTVEVVRDPEREEITVAFTGKAPSWLPSVPPAAIPIEGPTCEGATDDVLQRPAVRARMTGYSGDLCPEGSLDFSESSGVFSVYYRGDERTTGSKRCEVRFVMTVPPGLRFRRPVFLLSGDILSETESGPPTSVTASYAMASDPMSSHHQMLPTVDGDSFTLIDTPEIEAPECSAECEAIDLEIKVDVEINAPEGTSVKLWDLSCAHDLGVEWITCDREFQER